jgi:hypothetical protein
MATVTIVLTDLPENKVEVKATPTFESMIQQMDSGTALTSSQGYALAALNHIRREAQQKDPTKVWVPKKKH